MRSGRRHKKKRRFETTGVLVLGQMRTKRRPAYSSLLRRLRNALLLILVVASAGILWLTFDDRFYVHHIDVKGVVRTSPGEISQASGLPGLHILWVRSAESEEHILSQLPEIKSAQVDCRLWKTCSISVMERQPRIMWEDGDHLWWVDATGVIFPAEGTLSEGWVVRGPLPQDEEGQLDERARVALTELWLAKIDAPQPLYYAPDSGFTFVDERGWRVVLGQGEGLTKRLQVLEWLTADLEARDLTPRFVDVRFPSAPYYSLTNEW